MDSHRKFKTWAAKGVNFGVVAAFTAFAAFPFFWMVVTTFKQTNDLLNPKLTPQEIEDVVAYLNATYYKFPQQ